MQGRMREGGMKENIFEGLLAELLLVLIFGYFDDAALMRFQLLWLRVLI
jgi:hypothetical protein